MKKPILYHDLDGVLFGNYDGYFQLRPNVKGWLYWVHEHFELVWLTTWKPEDIKTLLSILYCEKFQADLPNVKLRVAQWSSMDEKELWLAHVAPNLKDQEWYWIDDNIPPVARLLELGLDPDRCLRVNPKGERELESLKERLLALLSQRVVKV